MSYTVNNTMIDDTITITGATGSSSQVYTTNNTAGSGLYWGMNGTSISPAQIISTTGTNNSWITQDPNLKGASIQVKGNAEFDGEVTIKGKNLTETLDRIEERLAILHPNPELEDKWDELKELSKRYKELEAEIIEKEKMWAILKK